MRGLLLVFLILTFGGVLTQVAQDKCRVLTLQGGGDKGSYQAGALEGLIESLPSEETKWDIITGISVGSINTLGMSRFKKGEEKQAIEFILKLWRDVKSWKDIYKRWPLWMLDPFIRKSGLYDTAPMKVFLKNAIQDKNIERKIIIGAVNLVDGVYKTWDETTLKNDDDFIEAVASSASFPIAFPYENFDNGHYVDGGISVGVDIFSGINRCLDMGFAEKDIVVDTVLCNQIGFDPNPKDILTPGVAFRIIEIMRHDNSIREVIDAVKLYPQINFRYLVAPEKMLPSGEFPLHFKPEQLEEMIEIGEVDGKKVVEEGEGKAFKRLINSRLTRDTRKSYRGNEVQELKFLN
jgi:predicted patatin/cPLA2 family phospholipase